MNSHFTCFTSIYFLILCVWTVFVQLGSASFCPRVPSHAPTKVAGCGTPPHSVACRGVVPSPCAVLCCVRGSSLNLVVNKNSLNYCSSSDKSKRRTKTVKKSLEPKWNQTFMYSPVHRREFRERMLEITLWDQARVREEESEFLGEVSKTPFCKLISFFSAGRSLLWRACVPRSLADPYRAGDGPPGRRAALVQATNPRCVLHPTSTCLPEHSTSAVPRRESDTATAEYGFFFLMSLTLVSQSPRY